ncbi:hypothetical protein QQF64_014991 [Cirrhinus molitorella]|uniref:Uncharacterized protein n=1 Tax=Cirrhinus molitorella TaxID=172907 RepID=A0ABR3NTP2_9TELE
MIPLSHRATSDSQSAALSLRPYEISERGRERASGDAVHRGGERERQGVHTVQCLHSAQRIHIESRTTLDSSALRYCVARWQQEGL